MNGPTAFGNGPTVCLNMIVKNESAVIRRMLASVVDLLDSYCICDTGSTDDTMDVIRAFFEEHRVPGKIVQEPFRDFGYNRTFALQRAAEMPSHVSEYVLLMDADMVLWRRPDLSVAEVKSRLIRNRVFLVYQGTDTFQYKNVRFVKNRMGITYWGVTHEYVKMPEGEDVPYGNYENNELFIRDIGDGGSKADKFERDIRLLKRGLEELPDNDRYTFYLANSYRDHAAALGIGTPDGGAAHQLAIETYQKRITIGGWVEEVWQSYYSMGKCYCDLDDFPRALHTWLEGYHAYPQRAENLYEIVKHYREKGQNSLAHVFWQMADTVRRTYPHRDYLFTQTDVYDYKLDYELSIFGYYCNPDKVNLSRVCMKVIQYRSLEGTIYHNVLSNYKFYAPAVATKYGLPLHPRNAEALAAVGRDLLAPFLGEYVPSTPSLCLDTKTGDLVVCVRYVNYRINDAGGYEGYAGGGQDIIATKNVVARFAGVNGDYDRPWSKRGDDLELHCDPTYNDGRYRGLEDVRLFSYDKYQGAGAGAGRLIYNANRGLEQVSASVPAPHDTAVMAVEHGWMVQDHAAGRLNCTNSKLLVYDRAHASLEKNWVLFGAQVAGRIVLKCVYSWSPLVLGTVCPTAGKFTETHRWEASTLPYFLKDMRCSTNGVAVGKDEIWFIGHLVSYEERRYYYHTVLVLDAATLALKKYTPLWTFEGAKVEYTLGMVYFSDYQRFLVGYSVLDRESKYMMVSKHVFDDMMILV
uniref:Glycosyltransferase 2-like domain-containing protein n=1 Tax=viral metagenome TaxID=1070528 RepID=A0A6C0EMF3_9ZZZZ